MTSPWRLSTTVRLMMLELSISASLMLITLALKVFVCVAVVVPSPSGLGGYTMAQADVVRFSCKVSIASWSESPGSYSWTNSMSSSS